MNLDGGGLSSNHPGMRGIFLVIEATKQLRGECGARQVQGAELACVHGTGGTLGVAHSGATLILGSRIDERHDPSVAVRLVGVARLVGGRRARRDRAAALHDVRRRPAQAAGATAPSASPDTIEHFVASGRGTVHTFTVTHQNMAPPFNEHLPVRAGLRRARRGAAGADQHRRRRPRRGDHRACRSSPTSPPPPETTARPSPCPGSGRHGRSHDPGPAHPLGALRRRPGQGGQLLPVDQEEGAAARRHRAHRAPPVRRRERLPRPGGRVRPADPQGQRGGDRLRPRARVRRQRRHGARVRLRPHRQPAAARCWSRPSACGGYAVPCHPGGATSGCSRTTPRRARSRASRWSRSTTAGSIPGEDERSREEAERYGYRGIGGSDSHIVSRIGLCATEFVDDIATIDDLVGALRAGRCEARTWRT